MKNNKLWGGRFTKKTDPAVEKFTSSIAYDYKLAEYDLLGSIAHVQVLGKAGIVSPAEKAKLIKGLNGILQKVRSGKFKPDAGCEDIHTNIQNLMEKRLGKVALKLHTARSRNDQVAFATKLYCLKSAQEIISRVKGLCQKLAGFSKRHKKTIFPGYTHLQHAQPVSLKLYLQAYVKMLHRDGQRLESLHKNINLTLGAGALAGTAIEAVKYKTTVEGLRIQSSDNPLDAVSDRDFALEALSVLAILGMHLSRLAEDLILYSTKEFGFLDLDEAFCTGSSLMPQKKNPDPLELIRGYSGRLYGNLVSVLATMKGLPLAYNRDMQLDKEPLFSSFEIARAELGILSRLIPKIKINQPRVNLQLDNEALYATDIADCLVKKGVAFKEAHQQTGRLFKYSLQNKKQVRDMSDKELKRFAPQINTKDIKRVINPQKSVRSKRSF